MREVNCDAKQLVCLARDDILRADVTSKIIALLYERDWNSIHDIFWCMPSRQFAGACIYSQIGITWSSAREASEKEAVTIMSRGSVT